MGFLPVGRKVSQGLEDKIEGFLRTMGIRVNDEVVVLGIPEIFRFIHPFPLREVALFPLAQVRFGVFNGNVVAIDDPVNPKGIITHEEDF